ncbi:hypothetical protein K2X83_02510 [Patescibacteria group bacterium]|nr:hypothetical protein [Patescibacteria group bacterium]
MADEEIKTQAGDIAGKNLTDKTPLDSFGSSAREGEKISPPPSLYVADKSSSGGIPPSVPNASIQQGEKIPPTPSLNVADNKPSAEIPVPPSVPQPASPFLDVKPPAPAMPPVTAEQSPFFGKIAPAQTPTPLNAPQPTAPQIPQQPEVRPTPPPSPAWNAPQKPTVPENTLRAEDKLHSGNIVSLLESRAQKESGNAPPRAGLKYAETPVERSIREIG